MCNYRQVEFKCGHARWTVVEWCTTYETTHKRCPPNVVAVEYRFAERCGSCRKESFIPPNYYVSQQDNRIRSR